MENVSKLRDYHVYYCRKHGRPVLGFRVLRFLILISAEKLVFRIPESENLDSDDSDAKCNKQNILRFSAFTDGNFFRDTWAVRQANDGDSSRSRSRISGPPLSR